MGIDTGAAQLLLGAKASGADFTEVLMIGRQFFYPDREALAQMLRWQGIEKDAGDLLRESGGWSEAFFRLLGARNVDSMDASPFEGAAVIHDLNMPIDDALKERFTVIFDGGTLEHVFNFPQALRNCMEMLKEGGTFIQYGPANNFMGHGFYQFSPELAFQVFSKANGFEVVAVLLQEAVRGGRWYTVANPADVAKRVQMTNRLPTVMCIIARRSERVPILQTAPQQTDYAAGWQQTGEKSGGVYKRDRPGWRTRMVGLVRQYLPEQAERFVRLAYTPGLEAQPECFRRLHIQQLVRGDLSMSPDRT
jgi:SAM-dependent methyltransferase